MAANSLFDTILQLTCLFTIPASVTRHEDHRCKNKTKKPYPHADTALMIERYEIGKATSSCGCGFSWCRQAVYSYAA